MYRKIREDKPFHPIFRHFLQSAVPRKPVGNRLQGEMYVRERRQVQFADWGMHLCSGYAIRFGFSLHKPTICACDLHDK